MQKFHVLSEIIIFIVDLEKKITSSQLKIIRNLGYRAAKKLKCQKIVMFT